MSAFAAALAKLTGSLGGPLVTTGLVVGGLVVGGLVGGLAAAGGPGGAPASSAARLAVYPCPGTGPALAEVGSGQQFLVTGRTPAGDWYRIHFPAPGRTEAWIEAARVRLVDAGASLPEAACAPQVAALVPPNEAPSLTAIENNSPTPPPVPNAEPALAKLAATPGEIAGGPKRYCAKTPRTVTVSVVVTDPDPLASVVLFYQEPGALGYAQKPMTQSAGTDSWQAVLDADADGIGGSGKLRYYVSATDAHAEPLTGRLPAEGAKTITVEACANEGPELASFKASPGKVYTNLGACRTSAETTTISVTASDVDDVTGVTLYYKLPGDGSYRDKAMTGSGERWSTKVTPVDERKNADGKASWYVVARDKPGKTTKSSARTFTVDRCNYKATIVFDDFSGSSMCPGRPTSFYAHAADRDGLDGTSATFVYTYRRTDGTSKTVRKRMSGDLDDPYWYYQTSITPGNDWATSAVAVISMTFFIETTDRYGGTSRGGSGQIRQGC